MIVMEYTGAGTDAPLALVGKGITFDTGGISLKPNSGQWLMKSDLSGAAAVAGTLISTAKRGADINLIGVMPLAENMPDGKAIRPGDVLSILQRLPDPLHVPWAMNMGLSSRVISNWRKP